MRTRFDNFQRSKIYTRISRADYFLPEDQSPESKFSNRITIHVPGNRVTKDVITESVEIIDRNSYLLVDRSKLTPETMFNLK